LTEKIIDTGMGMDCEMEEVKEAWVEEKKMDI